MSSLPFSLGIPVVDDIPPVDGSYVLRTKDRQDVTMKIQELQHKLSVNDLIKIYFIGYRPDSKIPVSRYFTEVHVEVGKSEEYHQLFGLYSVNTYHRVATGLKGEKE